MIVTDIRGNYDIILENVEKASIRAGRTVNDVMFGFC